MTGDQIVGCVAIVAMLALVVPRLVRDPTQTHKLLRMAGLWVLVIVAVTVVVMKLA